MDIRAAEISTILKKQIKGFGKEAKVSDVGQVLSVGDGIARVYGLDNVRRNHNSTNWWLLIQFHGLIREQRRHGGSSMWRRHLLACLQT